MRRRERILAALVVLLGVGVAAALFADITLRGQVSDNRNLVHALQQQVRGLGGNPLTQVPTPTPSRARPKPQPTVAATLAPTPAPTRTVVVPAKPAATPRPSPSRTSRPSPKPTPSRPRSPTPSPSLCVPVVGCVPAPAVGDH